MPLISTLYRHVVSVTKWMLDRLVQDMYKYVLAECRSMEAEKLVGSYLAIGE